MKETEPPEHDPVIPFPFPLPERLLDLIGYRGPDRLVGLYRDAGDKLGVIDSQRHWVGGHNHYPYLTLLREPRIDRWLEEFGVDLGSLDRLASHMMVVDREPNRGWLAEWGVGYRIVKAQSFDPRSSAY